MNESELYKKNSHLFQEAVARLEDPRQKGICVMSDDRGQCLMIKFDPYSGGLSRYDIAALSATIQTQDGVQQQVDLMNLCVKKCAFSYSALTSVQKRKVHIAFSQKIPEPSKSTRSAKDSPSRFRFRHRFAPIVNSI